MSRVARLAPEYRSVRHLIDASFFIRTPPSFCLEGYRPTRRRLDGPEGANIGEVVTRITVVHGKFSQVFISRGKGHVRDPLYLS